MVSKGLSPIIAVILIIIVVVALVIILYGFSVGILGGTSTAITEAQTGMTGSTSTGIIENIDTNANKIYMRSTNRTGSNLDAVYIDGKRYDNSSNGVPLAANSTATIDSSDWGNFDIVPNQAVVVAGTNNFRATSKS